MKIFGADKKTFQAKNTSASNSKKILFSASSDSEEPKFNILLGKEYLKKIGESKDGKTHLYSASIPQGQQISVVTPSQVSITPYPPLDLKIWRGDISDNETLEKLKNYYNLK